MKEALDALDALEMMDTLEADAARLDWLGDTLPMLTYNDYTRHYRVSDSASGDTLGAGRTLRAAIDDAMRNHP